MKKNIIGEDHNVIKQFNEIFSKHLKRLIGSEYEIDTPALDSISILLITLLMERENEIKSFAADEIDRYTRETLTEDIKDMGLNADRDMNEVIENMIEEDYVRVDSDRLIPQKPAMNLARLLDMVFPKMPGMNLAAYCIQTIDEVKSNRKDIDSARTQFDQTLRMQGVPLGKKPPDNDNKKPVILGRTPSDNTSKGYQDAPIEPKVLSPDAYKGKIHITTLNFGEYGSDNAEPDITLPVSDDTVVHEQIAQSKASTAEIPDQDSMLSPEETSDDPKLTNQDKKSDCDNNDDVSKTAPIRKEPETVKETLEGEPESETKKEISPINDDDIEKRVTAFEEDLSLGCPICKKSKLKVENTATGKTYYKCSNTDCSFISWGKPHHIICPKCNNPFLIETSDNAGQTILKCPRATCRYVEKTGPDTVLNGGKRKDSAFQKTDTIALTAQKPRRRVVRRRVVRRKR